MKSCPKSKCLISVVAVFIFIFVYDFLVHGILLEDAYNATANLWRNYDEMQSMMWMCFVMHGVLAFLYTALFCLSCKKSGGSCDSTPKTDEKKCCPIKRGVCFGTILGLILGVMNAGAYLHLPIPESLAISWFFASLVQGVGVGIILSLLNNKKSCGTKA